MSRTNHQLPNLDKLFKDEDEQDFAPLGGSNLAAIFGTPQKPADTSTSLKQTSQKKSSSGRSTPQAVQQQANKTEVIMAKAVVAYKLQNGQYSLVGKLGIALTGNATAHVYQIILYRSKQEHVSIVTLTADFSYIIRENNYATFTNICDGNNETWSILFDDENSCIEFARDVGVSRFLSRQTKTDDSVFYQNLSVQSEDNNAKENDKISVKTVICTSLTQPLKIDGLSAQVMNVEISQDDNWEKSLLNCSKGLKRLLILPPSKQISLGPGFPREREIIMEIEVIDITKPEIRSLPITKPPMSTGKASILSRMARMGQSMIPKIPTSTTTDSDTEEEIHVKSPRRLKTEVSASHASKHHSQLSQELSEEVTPNPRVLIPKSIVPANVPLAPRSIMPSSSFATPWPAGPIQQHYITMDGQYYPVHQPTVAQPISSGMDPNMNVFLSETRTQNSEIRMGMSKIADNVQKLLDKFHVLEVQSASSPMNERAMETSLKMLMALNASKIDGRGEILTNGKSVSNAELETFNANRTNDFEKERSLEKELDKAKVSVAEHAAKIEKLEREKREWNNEKSECNEKIERLEKSLAEAQIALQKSLMDLKTANESAICHQRENAVLEAKICKLNAEKDVLEKAATNALSETREPVHVNEKTMDIKRIMNKTYQTLLAKFTEESYTTEFIKQTMASTIRNITLQVLKEGSSDELAESTIKTEVKHSRNTSDEFKIKLTDVAPDPGPYTDANNTSITLPEINSLPSSLSVIPAVQEEPPPIPPMDLDPSDGDWLP